MKHFYSFVLLALFALCGLGSIAQQPVYNSYPSAKAVIFLDFDGHIVNGSLWNSDGAIVCGPSNMSPVQITEIFNRVAEDYRPFNVNITTDSAKYWAAPLKQRMRVILTTSNAWYGNSAGGVAFVNSYSWGDNTPCFIFTSLLGYEAKAVAEAASHEAGHTLGLRHQASYNASCVKTAEYNAGKGSGETGWAPIMGVGYYKNFTVWNMGPTPSTCGTIQNDLTIIAGTKNGFGFRNDDHADSITKASSLTISNQQFNLDGIIGKTEDVDVFKFKLEKKALFRLNAIPYNVGSSNAGSNLDMQVDLIDEAQTILGSYNPTTVLSSLVDTLLKEGTYYLRIDGTGNQNTSEYGSLGAYSLQGNFIDITPLPLRRLVLKGAVRSGKHFLNWEIDADEAIVMQQLEYSLDGRTYQVLANAPIEDVQYQYAPSTPGVMHYRLNVHFDNGKQHYSNVVSLRHTASQLQPRLLSNKINGQQLQVSCPGSLEYFILDYNGVVLMKGKTGGGTASIDIHGLNKGAYMIRFTNGATHLVEKFIKQ
jgi:hypothetical protein